jgi:SAM-dependent methyltransferase
MQPVNCSNKILDFSLIETSAYAVKRAMAQIVLQGNTPKPIDETLSKQIESGLKHLMLASNDLLIATQGSDQAKLVGEKILTEYLPFLSLSENATRWLLKPAGYAGDFETINLIYENQPKGKGFLGDFIDACFLNYPAPKAVRNRRNLMVEEILATEASVYSENRAINVMSLACGPSREVFDYFTRSKAPNKAKFTCIDIDYHALAFVADLRKQRGLVQNIRLECANLIHLATGKRSLSLEPQDLIYSIGLIDYFDDNFVVKLINYAYCHLKPGGRLILGNFHPSNPCRGFQDWALQWKLIYRSEEDMNRLFKESLFNKSCDRIRLEPEGVNLFASAVRPNSSKL